VEVVILASVCLLSLFLVPFGLPGLWVMVAAGAGYAMLVRDSIGWFTLAAVAGIAIAAEIGEFALAGRYARKYGGSRRAIWGAIIGGAAGAIIGVPVPVLGPILGAFLGAFVGALGAEYSRGSGAQVSARVATGALIGRAFASAMKVAAGFAMALWLVVAALAGR
jgi:uncharacterized protein YqgC (DUF456 family)